MLRENTSEISLEEIIRGIQKEARERRAHVVGWPGQAITTGTSQRFPKPEYKLRRVGGRLTRLLNSIGKLGLRIPVVSRFVRMSIESYVLPTKMNFLLQEIASLSDRLDKTDEEIKQRELQIRDLEKKLAMLQSETREGKRGS